MRPHSYLMNGEGSCYGSHIPLVRVSHPLLLLLLLSRCACRTGIMEMAVTMVEARRRKQAAAAASGSSRSSVSAAVPAKQEAAV